MYRSATATRSFGSISTRILVAAAFVLAAFIPSLSRAQIVRPSAWVTNGRVTSSAYSFSNNVIYLGGAFSQVGPAVGAAAALDVTSGLAQQPYPRVVGTVMAVAPDGSGGWYLGGLFTSIEDQPRTNLAQIDASGALTSWNPGADGEVDAILVSGSTVYVGGLFANTGGAARAFLAALSGSSGLATSWAPSVSGGVRSIGIVGSWLWIGGDFSLVGGQSHPGIAAVDVTTGAANAAVGSASSTSYLGMAVGGGRAIVCTSFNGNYDLEIYNGATGVLTASGPAIDGSVDAIAIDGATGYAYIGGNFIHAGGLARRGSAAFDPSTSAVLGWAPTSFQGINGSVRTIAINAGTVYIGGAFSSADGNNRDNIFAVDKGAGTITAWNPGAGATVRSLAATATMVYAGGEFGTVNTVRRGNVVAMNATTGTPTDWTPNANGEVDAIMPIGNSVYLGGSFTGLYWLTITLTPRNHAAAVDDASGLPLSFDPNVNSVVEALAYDGGKVYLGGVFSTVGGVGRVGLAAANPTTGALDAWTPACNGSVYALRVVTSSSIVTNPKVIVGGQFTSVGGAVRNNLASVDGVTGSALPWNPGPNATVSALLAFGTITGAISKVYAAGSFTTIGGQARSCVAAIDGTGTVTAWNPGASGSVYALASLNNEIYVGGNFTSAGGQSRSHIAEIDATTGLATAWDPVSQSGAPPGFVYTLFKANSTVFAGGSFLTMKGEPQQFFAMIGDVNVTAADGPEAPIAPRAVLASPNPFEGSTTLRFSLPRSERADVAVYDVSGRFVREVYDGPLSAGEHRYTWDGLDERSRAVASGIYFMSVRTPTLTLGSKVYRLR